MSKIFDKEREQKIKGDIKSELSKLKKNSNKKVYALLNMSDVYKTYVENLNKLEEFQLTEYLKAENSILAYDAVNMSVYINDGRADKFHFDSSRTAFIFSREMVLPNQLHKGSKDLTDNDCGNEL